MPDVGLESSSHDKEANELPTPTRLFTWKFSQSSLSIGIDFQLPLMYKINTLRISGAMYIKDGGK